MLINRKFFTLRMPADGEGAEPGGAAVGETQTPGAVADAENAGADDDQQQQQTEARARAMGWTPKSEFKGDPSKWRDAGEFVERGEREVPLLRAQNKRLEAKIGELSTTVKEFAEHLSKTEQRAYDRAIADLKEQRKAALAAGDGEAFEAVDDKIDQIKREAAAKAAKHSEKKDDGADPVYAEWESRNTWLKDAELSDYAEFAAQKLRASGEKATGAEFLDLVATKVKAQFPAKFTNPRRETAQAVEGAAPARRSGGKSYADMPAEARAACDRMAKNGFAGNDKAMAAFKADYVKQFFEEA